MDWRSTRTQARLISRCICCHRRDRRPRRLTASFRSCRAATPTRCVTQGTKGRVRPTASARSTAICEVRHVRRGSHHEHRAIYDPIKQQRGRDLVADSIEKVGIIKAATEDRLGASLSIQHRTINNRTINVEQVATSNAGQVLFMEDDLSTRQGNSVSLTHREFVLLIAATMSE
jgi:hypothetical protein